MSQQIIFKRGKDTYNSLNTAISAFNLLEWKAGEPAIARYLDEKGATRLLFAIGITDGIGSINYRVVSTFDSVEDLQKALGTLSTALSSHEDAMATDDIAGHVINDETSDIEFTNGIAKIKKGSVAIESLAGSTVSGIIGVKSEDLATGGTASLMTWADVIKELGSDEVGFRTFKSITINNSKAEATSLQDSLEITLDDNFTVIKQPGLSNKFNISFNGGNAEFSTSVETVSGPVKISGTTDALITSFSETEPVLFPSSPRITNGVTVDSTLDNDSSNAVPTIGFVNQKIKKALAENDSMHYMGAFDPTTQSLPVGNAGDTYKISVEGEISGLGLVHVGDMIICNSDNTVEATPENWDIIEVHSGTLVGPDSAVSGNLVVFDNASSVKDSGISADNIVINTRKVIAGDGLEFGADNKSGVLAGDVTINHAKKDVIEKEKETGDVVKSISVDEFGHISEVVYGEASKNLTLTHGGDGWSNNYLTAGKFINGIALENNVLTAYATDLPGTVRVASDATLGFLKDIVVGKSEDLKENEYAVVSAQKREKLELSVVIDKIDGGTF